MDFVKSVLYWYILIMSYVTIDSYLRSLYSLVLLHLTNNFNLNSGGGLLLNYRSYSLYCWSDTKFLKHFAKFNCSSNSA